MQTFTVTQTETAGYSVKQHTARRFIGSCRASLATKGQIPLERPDRTGPDRTRPDEYFRVSDQVSDQVSDMSSSTSETLSLTKSETFVT